MKPQLTEEMGYNNQENMLLQSWQTQRGDFLAV